METPMEELSARLAARHAAFCRTGLLHRESEREPAWWRRSASEPTDVRWMSAAATYGDQQTRERFRDGAEAIALLNALARADFPAFEREVERTRPRRRPGLFETVRRDRTRWEIGFAYQIYERDDIVPVCDRIMTVEPPCEAFVSDYAWLKNTFPGAEETTTPIAVQILICLSGEVADDLEAVLNDIVQALTGRPVHHITDDINAQASNSTRFDIVEIDLVDHANTPLTFGSLECLAQLAQLGVRVPTLPAIHLDNVASSQDPIPFMKALHTLIPPVVESALSSSPLPRVQCVHTNEAVTSRKVPAVFSALQSSRDIDTVAVGLHFDPADLEDLNDPDAAMTLWKWAAYALFSRHANPRLKKVAVDFTFLERNMLNAIEHIVQAKNPLAALLGTTSKDLDWILASRFSIRDPDSPLLEKDPSAFVSEEPLRVRVVDSSEKQDTNWWRVLLPGLGEAWVRVEDATEISERDMVLTMPRAPSPLHLKVPEVNHFNIGDILTLLRALPREVASIEIEHGEHEEDEFDVTDWTIDVLRFLPGLERLQFTCLAEIQRLSIFVEAAESGHARLRSLALRQTFYPDTTDIMEFLAILSDRNHPLTCHLKELELTVCVREETPFEVFELAWRRMLRRNRTLRTVALLLIASQRVGEYDEGDDDPAFYSLPLDTNAMIAFLSAVHPLNCDVTARGRLDTGVITTIFSFAAQPRSVTVSFDEI